MPTGRYEGETDEQRKARMTAVINKRWSNTPPDERRKLLTHAANERWKFHEKTRRKSPSKAKRAASNSGAADVAA